MPRGTEKYAGGGLSATLLVVAPNRYCRGVPCSSWGLGLGRWRCTTTGVLVIPRVMVVMDDVEFAFQYCRGRLNGVYVGLSPGRLSIHEDDKPVATVVLL